MNKQGAVLVLTTLSAYQPVERNDSVVESWLASLDPNMNGDWAVRYVADWASKRTDQQERLLPGHLNKAWRDRENSRRIAQQATVTGPVEERVPMPEWFKAAMHDAFKGSRTSPDGDPISVGEIFADAMSMSVPSNGAPIMRACRNPECACMHVRCYDGWMDGPQYEGRAVPCVFCKPTLANVLAQMPGPGSRTAADMERVRSHGKSDH
jgi:hypothetical protein